MSVEAKYSDNWDDLNSLNREHPFVPVLPSKASSTPPAIGRENPFKPITPGEAGSNGTSQKDYRYNLGGVDIAQSRCFTITLGNSSDPEPLKFPEYFVSKYGRFLPVKSIDLAYTNFEGLSIPLSILGNIPVVNRKTISTIRLTCYDPDDDIIERAINDWIKECFPSNKFVQFTDECCRELCYTSFDVKGKPHLKKTWYVIPVEGVSVSRGYEENSEKLVTFTLAAVGEPGASINGCC